MSRYRVPEDAQGRLAARDGSLFSQDPVIAAEAAAFMGWTHLAQHAEQTLASVERIAAQARAEGVTDVVLLGMGGSSLAALVLGELLGAPDGARLLVLDTTSPVTVARALAATDPATTLHLVSSKSGGTVEPNALYAIFRARADEALGRGRAGSRFIAVTDPGSSLQALAEADDMRECVLTPPDVGGRYSALTAFGLLPAALAGVDVRRLVRSAEAMERRFAHGNGPMELAAAMVDALDHGADKLIISAPPELRVFGYWVEQLVAESLGKNGTGIVPVIDLSDSPTSGAAVEIRFSRGGRDDVDAQPPVVQRFDDAYDVGGLFVMWEYSVAMAGAAIGVNPFDQPDVARAKAATSAVLDGVDAAMSPDFAVDGVELTFSGAWHAPDHPERSLAAALLHAMREVGTSGYLALLTYLPNDPDLLAPVSRVVAEASRVTGQPICLELGPRYLHSTGQLHKGGPNSGVFVIVTTRDETDLPVPGRPWTLRQLHCAQADGDLATLAALGRRVLRIALPGATGASILMLARAIEMAATALARRS